MNLVLLGDTNGNLLCPSKAMAHLDGQNLMVTGVGMIQDLGGISHSIGRTTDKNPLGRGLYSLTITEMVSTIGSGSTLMTINQVLSVNRKNLWVHV